MKVRYIFLFIIAGGILFSEDFFSGTINAAVDWGDGSAFLFRGESYVKVNSRTNEVEPGYPKKISQGWPGVSFRSLDAVLDFGNGKIYFFKGREYIRFDKGQMRADRGYPKPINDNTWPGLGFTTVDAAINWGNGKAYLFKGNRYVRYDIGRDEADSGYPRTINNSSWPTLAFNRIDAAFLSGNYAYLFSGHQLVKYDTKDEKVAAGFPQRVIEYWHSPEKKEQQRLSTSEMVDYDSFKVTKAEINLAPYKVRSPNSVLGSAFAQTFPDGDIMIAFQQEHDLVLMRLDSDFKRKGEPIVLGKYWYSDMMTMEDGSLMLLAGRDVNNTYIEDYPNTLYLFKFDKRGQEQFKSYIFGGNGHGPGKSWFDGRSKARLSYNGSLFGIYLEVQKNWAAPGAKDDIHNGDMFAVVDNRGRLLDDRTHFWTASHSSTIQVTSLKSGEFYTMTIGDAYPYGLQVYNRDKDRSFVAWPPKEYWISYEEVNSTNAAGILEYIDTAGDDLVAFLGSLENPNIGWKSKVDPLFLRISPEGKVVVKRWLEQNSSKDAANITVVKKGETFIVGWGAGNDYDNNWQESDLTLAVIDDEGNFIMAPKVLAEPFGTYSRFNMQADGSIFWLNSANGSGTIDVHIVEFE